MPVADIIRRHLIAISGVKRSLEGKGEKIEQLYNYISGSQFKNRVENILLGFSGMKENLDLQKRSMERIWARTEKEIERVISNTAGMYGDLEGIIGASLPQIKSLEVPALESGESNQKQLKIGNKNINL